MTDGASNAGERFVSPCRRCSAPVDVDLTVPLPTYFPFCSERRRLIDLGRWFDEDFKVSREIHEADLDAE